jgi:hypothetical protein
MIPQGLIKFTSNLLFATNFMYVNIFFKMSLAKFALKLTITEMAIFYENF